MALHEQCVGKTNEWYTPRHVFDALGCRFDLDVATPARRNFVSVPTSRFISSDSLSAEWDGFIWMNPPFGARNGIADWLDKFFQHGNGIALTPDRTSAPWWGNHAPKADLVLVVSKKLHFIDINGRPGTSPGQGTTLLAAGEKAVAALHNAARNGLGSLWRTLPPHVRQGDGGAK